MNVHQKFKPILTNRLRKMIRDKAEHCINPSGNVGKIELVEEEISYSIRIEILKWGHGNFIDHYSMGSLLKFLQDNGVVGRTTKSMWVGMFDSRMYVWCVC